MKFFLENRNLLKIEQNIWDFTRRNKTAKLKNQKAPSWSEMASGCCYSRYKCNAKRASGL